MSDSEQVEIDYEVSEIVLRYLDDGWKCTVDGAEVGGVQERYRKLLKYYIGMFYDVSFDTEKRIIIITSKETQKKIKKP
ncbi:MAG: hypothetical protein LUD07_07875 [Clostridiales bacterium]|nr:hypothetical protein [Clostridiales bacterium]